MYSNGNVRFQNFMHMEWSEEKLLRRSQDRFLRQKIERFFWTDFSGEEFRKKHYCPYNIVPINWLWSGFIFPELEHL